MTDSIREGLAHVGEGVLHTREGVLQPTAPLVRVTSDPLDLAEHLTAVEDRTCGAVVTFVGQIRDHAPDADGEVTGIEYSAHPDAQEVLESIVARVRELPVAGPTPALIAVSHRVGPLAVGDVALLACVATSHRAGAYEVSRALVETIKTDLPVWKKQRTADGATHWVGL